MTTHALPLSAPPPVADEPHCRNCGAPLYGPYCYACGQPISGMVRHFSTVIGDVLDTTLDLDSRTARTLWPLLARPGTLTLEYFRGHRVRYVSPVRLFFFLCLAAFLLMRWSLDPGGPAQDDSDAAFAQAATVEDVQQVRQQALDRLRQARTPELPAVANAALATAEHEIERQAQQRTAPADTASAEQAPSVPHTRLPTLDFGNGPWHATQNPVQFDWLPDMGNRILNGWIGRAQRNLAQIRQDRSRLTETYLQTLPQSLFALVPIFALVLKLFYLRSHRLYMEHLIVVLHSHAFLCAMLLLVLGTADLAGLAGGAVATALGWLNVAWLGWIPVYLLLMQKRVYRQGWPVTLVKFFLLGQIHLALLTAGALISLAISLVTM